MRQHVSPELRLGFWEEIPEHLYDTAKTNATRRISRGKAPFTLISFKISFDFL